MMSDRIDELVAEAEFLNDNGCDKCEIVAQLATIAREAEANTKGQEANAVFALQLKRDAEERALKAEAEADKWRKVAEWLAMDGGLWSPTGAAKRIAHALAAVEQEETK
jgi:hypothetical protein